MNLEACEGCGLDGWRWQDNGWGYGVLGPTIYFATTGTQKLRIQTREDGLSIDRVLLSPSTYLKTKPPALSTSSSAPASTSTSTSTSSATLKVLDWNIHHGVGTDGKYNITRIADYIASTGANVVSLNEVEKNVGGYGNEDQPARFAAMLKSKTGKTWYYNFAHRTGGTNGQGNLLLTTLPDRIRRRLRAELRPLGGPDRDHRERHPGESSTRRTSTPIRARAASTQMKQLKAWADNYPEQRILAGDFNAWPGATEIDVMTAKHNDSWALAVSEQHRRRLLRQHRREHAQQPDRLHLLLEGGDPSEAQAGACVRHAELERRDAVRPSSADGDLRGQVDKDTVWQFRRTVQQCQLMSRRRNC